MMGRESGCNNAESDVRINLSQLSLAASNRPVAEGNGEYLFCFLPPDLIGCTRFDAAGNPHESHGREVMGISARNVVSLLATFFWVVGWRSLRTWNAAAVSSSPRPLAGRLSPLHPIRRFDRSEEFIVLFLYSGWRYIPCLSPSTRGRPRSADH